GWRSSSAPGRSTSSRPCPGTSAASCCAGRSASPTGPTARPASNETFRTTGQPGRQGEPVTSNDYEKIVYTVGEKGIVLLELNQPDRLNPIDPLSTESEIADALARAEHDPEVRVVIITGRGRAFSAGADLRNKPQPKTEYDANATMPQRLAYDYSY